MKRKFWTLGRKPRRSYDREDNIFSKLADENVLDFSQYRKSAENIADELVATLRDSDVQMVKHVIVGSIGKRISLGSGHNPDIDILLLLPKPELEADTTLEEIQKHQTKIVEKVAKILKRNSTYKHLRSNQNAQKYGITVRVKVGRDQYRKLDIVTGIHFEPSMGNRLPSYFGQWKAVMQYMSSKDLDAQQDLCGSLVEISTFFTKYQPHFVVRFVRLVKLWRRNNISKNRECFNGQATVLELMAIKAASEQVKKSGSQIKKTSSSTQSNKSELPDSRPSFTLAFEEFFKIMKTEFSEIRIWFDAEDYPAEKLRPVPDIVLRALKESRLKYKDSGMLLDPANPYHNFLADPTVKPVYEFYRRKAAESYNWLKKHMDRPKKLDGDMSIIERLMQGTL